MQHANAMRRRNRLRNINQKMQPEIGRNILQSTLCRRPLRQIRSRVFTLQKKRRSLKIPLEYPDKFPTVAERLPQKARNRDLAFQTFKPHSIRRKLKNSLLMRLRIFASHTSLDPDISIAR